MPKGPRGEKRPADSVGAAVKVAMIATGEIEDERYVSPGRARSGRAGSKARNEGLTVARRKEIAQSAADSRWGDKEAPMTERKRLLHTLFETEGKEHLNLKFCRGLSDDILPEDLCREANAAIFQIENGLVETSPTFGDVGHKVVDVTQLAERQ